MTAQRISIEDGAFFKGGIDIRKPGNEPKQVKFGAGEFGRQCEREFRGWQAGSGTSVTRATTY